MKEDQMGKNEQKLGDAYKIHQVCDVYQGNRDEEICGSEGRSELKRVLLAFIPFPV